MSSVTTRHASGVSVVVVRDTPMDGTSHVNGLGAWVSSSDWTIDTSGATEGTYSVADERRYLTGAGPNEVAAASTNVTVEYSAAADNTASGAVRWGLPRTVGNGSATKLVSVFAPASR